MLKIMTRVCVDKRTGTTSAMKKYVDKGYLTWYEWGWEGSRPVENAANPYKSGMYEGETV